MSGLNSHPNTPAPTYPHPQTSMHNRAPTNCLILAVTHTYPHTYLLMKLHVNRPNTKKARKKIEKRRNKSPLRRSGDKNNDIFLC